MIKKTLKEFQLQKDITNTCKSINSYTRPSKNKNILFCPMNGTFLNTIRENILASICNSENVNTSLLYLDYQLDFTEFYDTTSDYLKFKLKVERNISITKSTNNHVIRLSKYIKKKTYPLSINQSNIDDLEYKNIKIGDLLLSSGVRKLLSHGPEWDDPQFVNVINRAYQTACYLVDAYTILLKENSFDKIVMTHGTYLTWGILFRLARKNNIPVDVYNGSYRKNTIRVYQNTPSAPFPRGYWDMFKDTPLTNKEVSWVDDYFKTRETQSEDVFKLMDKNSPISNEIRTFVKQNNNKPIFCLFSNISWDAFSFSEGAIFETMEQWIISTLEYFQSRPDFALIIKAHPAEIIHNTPDKYKVKSIIKKYNLNDNILFVPETDKTKPFDLYEIIDYGIINISTVAIEMALKNIKVLTSGANGHYSNHGFTIDPKSLTEYYQTIDELGQRKNKFEPNLEVAKRYLHYRFFKEAIYFDPLQMGNGYEIASVSGNLSETLDDQNSGISIFIDTILNNTPCIQK